jgi:hypothetical protein
MYLLVSKTRFLEFRLPLSRVAPYLQFVTLNCLIQSQKVISTFETIQVGPATFWSSTSLRYLGLPFGKSIRSAKQLTIDYFKEKFTRLSPVFSLCLRWMTLQSFIYSGLLQIAYLTGFSWLVSLYSSKFVPLGKAVPRGGGLGVWTP